jgi:hypothetical protein
MGLNLTTPLLAALALLNTALIFYSGSRRVRLLVAVSLVGLSSLLLTDWLEGFLYLVLMP